MSTERRTTVGLHLFNALSAVGGGIALAADLLGVPTTLLRHTPFTSFVAPGVFLAVVIGGSATIGAAALLARWPRALVTSGAAGAVMVGWILGETLLVEGFSWLQGLYLATGAFVLVSSLRQSRATSTASAPRGAAEPRDDQGALR